ncbi:DUF2381 family protein [Pyxidicoccus fallax]|uniref:DUF2381 family protein n=1 Tax=Pyxidicoccus fallax TaxID=394095 RepID=A0A848LX30_9BACT|nr:DUF2381 family protein [Pyxidicoccus fallax]NMO22708.1 DUF2381 family protein [Pyxidicoccus fallax]NPC84842.1 DUF2381 family protein [Pyxidicoccus fallax]
MQYVLPARSVLFLVLLASAAVAQERTSVIRDVVLPDQPGEVANSVYVAGGIASVLRFQQSVDADKTRLLGWEGRFEPLVAQGRSVVLFPLQNLTSEDRLLLLVTLKDGTELPFTVTSRAEKVDHQVNVVPDDDSLPSVRAQLSNALLRERLNAADAERYRQEKNSVDHSLAALLVSGASRQTPFRWKQRQRLDCDGAEVDVSWFAGKGKTAVLLNVRNRDAQKPWRLGEVRLSTVETREGRPFALRTDREEIAPGASGIFAVVADASAFDSKQGVQQLVLELFRPDGVGQFQVVLDPRYVRE